MEQLACNYLINMRFFLHRENLKFIKFYIMILAALLKNVFKVMKWKIHWSTDPVFTIFQFFIVMHFFISFFRGKKGEGFWMCMIKCKMHDYQRFDQSLIKAIWHKLECNIQCKVYILFSYFWCVWFTLFHLYAVLIFSHWNWH